MDVPQHKQEIHRFLQMPGTLAGKARSFPALDDALQLAQRGPSADTHSTQDEDSLLRSQWSIKAIPGLAAKAQDFDLLRRWLSVSPKMPPVTWSGTEGALPIRMLLGRLRDLCLHTVNIMQETDVQ